MSNLFKTTFLLGALTGLIMLLGGILGGRHGVEFAFAIAAVMNLVSYWWSDKIVLRAYGARPLGPSDAPELNAIVNELAQAAQIPMPRLYLIDSDTPNAFATGRNPSHAAVAVTRGIMRMCNREESRACSAMSSHVINRDILTSSIAATLAGAVMMIATWARWAAIFGGIGSDEDERGGIIGLLLMSILAPIAATLIQLAISRTREYQADASGARLVHNPMYLASALHKLEAANQRLPLEASPSTAHLFIVNPLSAEGAMRLFSTHPPTEERIRRLEQMAASGNF